MFLGKSVLKLCIGFDNWSTWRTHVRLLLAYAWFWTCVCWPVLSFFSLWVFKVFKIFLVLIILNCLKTYCYIFDFKFICLSLEETYSLLFKSLLLFIRLLVYLFVLGRDIFFTVYICFLKKTYFSFFHANYFLICFMLLLYNYFNFMAPRLGFLKVSKICLK